LTQVKDLEGGIEAQFELLELSRVGGGGGGALGFGRSTLGKFFNGGCADLVCLGPKVGYGGVFIDYLTTCFFDLLSVVSMITC
jgi:hypothetical protein